MKILNNQTVGQSLTLECTVTMVRGVISTVDILWIGDGSELKRIENVNFSLVTNNSELVQVTDLYIIPILSTADEDRSYKCEMLMAAESMVEASDSISLNVTG